MRYWAHTDTDSTGGVADMATGPLEAASRAREAALRYSKAGTGDDVAPVREAMRARAVRSCCEVMRSTFSLLDALGVSQQELDAAMRGDE